MRKRLAATSPAIRIPGEGRFKLKFFSNDAEEPPHVHVLRESRVAKFWLYPEVKRAHSLSGKPMKPYEAREAMRFVEENQDRILEAWHAFFARRGL